MTPGEHRQLASPLLRPHFASYCLLPGLPETGSEAGAWRILPETTGNLILHLYEDGRPSPVLAVGARSVGVDVDRRGRRLTVLLQLQAGAQQTVLGIPGSETRDRALDLAELWGKSALELRQLLIAAAETGDWSGVEAMLGRRLARTPPPPTLVQRALATLTRSEGRMRARELANHMGVGERHLRRQLGSHTGLGPKRLGRILRVHHALRAADSCPRVDWADLAARCGYSDQSHLVDEWGELLGDSPERFLARSEREIAGPLLPRRDARAR